MSLQMTDTGTWPPAGRLCPTGTYCVSAELWLCPFQHDWDAHLAVQNLGLEPCKWGAGGRSSLPVLLLPILAADGCWAMDWLVFPAELGLTAGHSW